MKKYILFFVLAVTSITCFAQDTNDKATNKKKKGFGERISDLTGKLLTAKTDNLSNIALSTNIVSGIFDMRTAATETKYYPKGTQEGDYIVSVSFLKNQGTGMLELKGEVKCDGVAMESIGLGSYAIVFKEPFTQPKKISIKAENGDFAEFTLNPIPEIEIISINKDKTLPILDLAEDITVEYTNPPGSENTTVYAGMLTDIMGVRAWNYFADFPAKKNVVTIPKEALSNLTISGKMNAGQLNKGENFFVLERQLKIENSNVSAENNRGKIPSVTMAARAYSSWPVIVKGKQEEGVITDLNFSGLANGQNGFSVHKPNAQRGIPLSRGSKFGLSSLVVNGRLYHKESHSSSSSWDVGNTRYTRTTTVTTTLEFPQLPNGHWDNLLDAFYKKLTPVFKNKFNIGFTDVDKITQSASYASAFQVEEQNTYTKISRTYKNTQRTSPQKLSEIFKSLSSSQSVETPVNKLMQETDTDGLVSIELNLDIAADKDNHVVLIPSINFSILGRDETKNNRNGTYAEGKIVSGVGIPFNGDVVRADPNSLSRIINIDQLVSALEYVLINLQAKEIAMGYDKIWSIGE